jgi:putative FmdB family regulatory protein
MLRFWVRGNSAVPLYEYQCAKCGRFEVIQKFSDSPLEACPTCGKSVTKLLSAPAFQFKGTGWYVTDYARKGGEGAKVKESTPAKETSSKESSSTSSDKSSPSTSTSTTSSASGSSPSK